MKNLMRLTLGGLLLASSSVMALNVDPTGTGGAGGTFFFGQNTSFIADNLLLDQALSATAPSSGDTLNNTATIFYQTLHGFDTDGDNADDMALTINLTLPVDITYSIDLILNRLNIAMSIDTDRNSLFDLYLQDNFNPNTYNNTCLGGDLCQSAGTGYSDIWLASGQVTATPSAPVLTIEQKSSSTSLDLDGSSGTPKTTLSMSGGWSVQIDISTQDRDYVVSDLAQILLGINVDVELSGLALNAPFLTAEVASSVLGNTPFIGSDNFQSDSCNISLSDANAGETLCDFQLESLTAVDFNDAPIPEPTSVALIGLGLAALGIRRRRRV